MANVYKLKVLINNMRVLCYLCIPNWIKKNLLFNSNIKHISLKWKEILKNQKTLKKKQQPTFLVGVNQIKQLNSFLSKVQSKGYKLLKILGYQFPTFRISKKLLYA